LGPVIFTSSLNDEGSYIVGHESTASAIRSKLSHCETYDVGLDNGTGRPPMGRPCTLVC